jgi:hypothetical protein
MSAAKGRAIPDSIRDRLSQIAMPAYQRQTVIADYEVASRLVDTFHGTAVSLVLQLCRTWRRCTTRPSAVA